MQKINLSIAIPSNVLEDCSDLRSKTQKIGQIGRATAIFRVKQIIIYSIDKVNQKKYLNDVRLIKGVLEYLDCPQYLRKKIFPKVSMFKYVGILPPLRTPHHPLDKDITKIKSNSIREGLIISSNKQFSEVEIGLDRAIRIKVPNLPKNKRITLKLIKQRNVLSGVPIKETEIKEYWGFKVDIFDDSLEAFIKKFNKYTIIATSKRGAPISLENIELVHKIEEKKKALVLFGSPITGLFEIFKNNGLKLVDWADFIINFVPEQGTETIRVEEAIIATLTILNCLMTR